MKFRQRLAWLIVIGYLCATFGIFYYLFEISEHYNKFALEHVESHHQETSPQRTSGLGKITSLWHHIMDIPLAVWLILLLLPYLQVFCVLLACTKPEPKLSMALTWPGLLLLKCHEMYKKFSGMERSSIKPGAQAVLNGHVVIDA